jgi:predicted RNA binding protein YcfA (HicA-like mRNA interferase family)
MANHEQLLARILRGGADANVDFKELCSLLRHLGFEERIRGSHHIFQRDGVRELINLQRDGSSAKAYQIRQIRRVLLRYRLHLRGEEGK